jgi:LEA14-like dessication related protein
MFAMENIQIAEGVVCKGMNRDGSVWMVKIKTYAYMQKLKQTFQQDWLNYWE